jgi:hypothetical protein
MFPANTFSEGKTDAVVLMWTPVVENKPVTEAEMKAPVQLFVPPCNNNGGEPPVPPNSGFG